MEKKWIKIFMAVLLSGLLCGCGKKDVSLLGGSASVEAVTETEEGAENGTQEVQVKPETVCVYICGAVHVPGVYELDAGSRICDAVAAAGGLSAEADQTVVNQAETVTDGMMVNIPEAGTDGENGAKETEADDGLVNLNTASAEELMTLPGIGESKAAAIIAYREENGGFQSPEDIMNITGIKEGVYQKIKELVKI